VRPVAIILALAAVAAVGYVAWELFAPSARPTPLTIHASDPAWSQATGLGLVGLGAWLQGK